MDFDGEIEEVDIDKVCFHGITPGKCSGYSKKRQKKKKNSSSEASSAANSQNTNEQPESEEDNSNSESEGNDNKESNENDNIGFLNADIDDNSGIETESSDILTLLEVIATGISTKTKMRSLMNERIHSVVVTNPNTPP
eukprot:Pgem_evm2s19796